MQTNIIPQCVAGAVTLLFLATPALAADPPTPTVTESPAPLEKTFAPQQTDGASTLSDVPAPEKRSWVNRPLLITSAIVLVGSYVPMTAVAFTSSRPADQTNLYYPVVGPWMDLADRGCDVRSCSNEGLNKVLLVASGIGQGLGAIGVVASFFVPNKATRSWYLIGDARLHGGPTNIGMGGYGLGASGKF